MRILRVLGSWWTTALFALALLGAYVYYTFSENPYEQLLGFVFRSLPGIVLYFGLIVATVLASIRVIFEKMAPEVPTAGSITRMDVHSVLATADGVEGLLQKGGFSSTDVSAEVLRNGLCKRKGRYSFLPGTMLRVGIVLFLIALSLSVHTRKTEEVVLSEGDGAELLDRRVSLDSVHAKLEEDYLRLGGKGSFNIHELSAVIRRDERTFTVTGAKPTRDDGRYYRVTHLGYHQPIQIDGSSMGADLDVLPPGKAHVVELPEGIGSVSFVLEPERTVKKGLLTGKIYNLQQPRYRLKFQTQDGMGGVAGLDGEVRVDGYRVVLGNPSLYVKVQSTYDPAIPWLYVGFILTLVGAALMALRLFWFEKRLCIIDVNGRVFAGYSEEFYKKWGIMKFRKWLEYPPANESKSVT